MVTGVLRSVFVEVKAQYRLRRLQLRRPVKWVPKLTGFHQGFLSVLVQWCHLVLLYFPRTYLVPDLPTVSKSVPLTRKELVQESKREVGTMSDLLLFFL